MEEELKNKGIEIEKMKTALNGLQYDKKVLNEEVDQNNKEIKDLKAIKDKYYELMREHKILTEDKNHVSKQLEKALSSK